MVGWGWQSKITSKLTNEEDFIQDYFSKGERLSLTESNGWGDFRHWSGLMRKCWRIFFFWGGGDDQLFLCLQMFSSEIRLSVFAHWPSIEVRLPPSHRD